MRRARVGRSRPRSKAIARRAGRAMPGARISMAPALGHRYLPLRSSPSSSLSLSLSPRRIESRRDEEPSRVQPQPDSTQASEKLQTDLLRENHPELLLSSPAARSYRGAQAMRFALSASRDSGGWR
ncbi:hypothetical protein EGT59_08260 [Burkholderia mallei]|nr:hypothetical protein D8O03_11265 [Burkholderia mallei]RPA40251.1 hypothetical protein EGT59_08260 [Burkholderia mallei]